MPILRGIPVTIDIEALLESAHLSPEREPGQELQAIMADMLPSVAPKALYQETYIRAKEDGAVMIDDIRLTSRVLRVNLDAVERLFPYVVTCGTEVETLTAQYDDMLYCYVLDAFKERVLRCAVQHLRAHIQKTHAPGALSSMNPGSLADWPLREQRRLFALLGDVNGAIGVELTESFLMHPVKSVSGILFPTDVSFENCQLCPRPDCPGRRAPYDPALMQAKYAPSGDS